MVSVRGFQMQGRRQHVRTALTSSFLGAALLLLSASAWAGPLNADHRFERIGGGLDNAVALLPMPGFRRALVLQQSGELRLISGQGGQALISEPVGQVAVATDCQAKGLLGGVWAPDGVGRELYLTYVAASTGLFTVGRASFDSRMEMVDLATIYQSPSPAACQNTGGGIVFRDDGSLYVGVGDMGNSMAAGQSTNQLGKILRMTVDGGPPLPPLPPNPFGASLIYSPGVRNPVRLARDGDTGDVWFLDLGPGNNDELNLIQWQVNYGWNQTEQMGRTGGPGDPLHVWSPAIGPAGLFSYRYNNIAPPNGDLLIAAQDGGISQVTPVIGDPLGSRESLLFWPNVTGPQSFRDLAVLSDGFVYVIDEGGEIWRILDGTTTPRIPSGDDSIVPMLVTKTSNGVVRIAGERMAGATEFGLYVGDLDLIWQDNTYNHPIVADTYPAVDDVLDNAWSRFDVAPTDLNGTGSAYVLLSAQNGSAETGLGFGSGGITRPGGNQSFSCKDCAGRALGGRDGDCEPEWALPYAIRGVGNVIPGGINLPSDWDCQVIQLSMSAEWCGPCRTLARDAERVQDLHGARGLQIIDVLFENNAGGLATEATVDAWAVDHGLVDVITAGDINRQVWNTHSTGFIPHTTVIGCDGVIRATIIGADPGGVEAAVLAELDADRCN